MFDYLDEKRDASLACARGIADWFVAVQQPATDCNPAAGSIPFEIGLDVPESCAPQWNLAFAIMGLLSGTKAFGDDRYERSALAMAEYLKTLQILDPFNRQDYGAIREFTPQTPWCYTRDALSCAWAFLELYRYTGDNEYLQRARLWGEWFMQNGLDEEGWPLWGCQFGPYRQRAPQMCNDLQGSFQGGSLNFLYHLSKTTGEDQWTGDVFIRMADHFIAHIQQEDGFFRSIARKTHRFKGDPQDGLHRANDDLGTLGLLCAYEVTKDERYLAAINRFITAVFKGQRDDGHFEQSCAGIPVVLNTILEGGGRVTHPDEIAVGRALDALISRQCKGEFNPRMRGGLLEMDEGKVETRSSFYSLIVLLKIFTKQEDYLRV